MPTLDEELALGLKAIHHHTLENSLNSILKCCMDADATRDPKRVAEIMGKVGEEVAELAGDFGNLDEIVEMLASPEGQEMMKQGMTQQLLGMKMAAWGVIDSVVRWTDDPTFHAHMKMAAGHDVTPAGIRAKFEERMEEWLGLDRPELMFAARAHRALDYLKGMAPDPNIPGAQYTGLVFVLLDGPGWMGGS